jgi:hypothetical protein
MEKMVTASFFFFSLSKMELPEVQDFEASKLGTKS